MTAIDHSVRERTPGAIENAILVRLILPTDSDDEVEESLDEMRQLAWTAGADVVCTILQRRLKPCPATLIGAGKVTQIVAACEEHEADLVIVDSDLTPTQGAKLQQAAGVKVLDRTQLILDIFGQRARTSEGKYQVELARLDYMLPRLKGLGAALMRQKGGIGLRGGPGEQKLEVDRRVVRARIGLLKREIDEIRQHRRVQRKRREQGGTFSAALVGYTNAGKSSLLNALTGAGAFVEDKLFATLDPLSRRCMLPSRREVVFTDTVGFIRKLPHSLVAAFRATLEEVNEADLILLVADAAHPAVKEHIATVYGVLDEVQAEAGSASGCERQILTVFNKTDIAGPAAVRQLLNDIHHGLSDAAVAVSAKTGDGLDVLLREIDVRLVPMRIPVMLRIPQEEAGVVARVYERGRVLSQTYEDNMILLHAEIDRAFQRQVARFLAVP